MSAPYYPPGGSPAELRETIAELMGVVEIRAGIVQRYAEIGDDVGLAYALRCTAAELKAALGLGGMLAEVTQAERERRRALRPSSSTQYAEARP